MVKERGQTTENGRQRSEVRRRRTVGRRGEGVTRRHGEEARGLLGANTPALHYSNTPSNIVPVGAAFPT